MKFKPFVPYLILSVVVVAVYANTLGHGFVWDDSIFVVHRSGAYKEFDLSAIFFTLTANGLEYLPVRDLSYALDFAVWGVNPAGFHISNVILFLLNVILIYLFTVKLLKLLQERSGSSRTDTSGSAAFYTAALFAVHPIHGEVVNFITMRNALLCGLFFFMTCLCYLNFITSDLSRRQWWYAASLVYFILTIFSKATGIITPLILVILTYTFRRPNRLFGWLPLLPFLFSSAGVFMLFKQVAVATNIIKQSSTHNILEKIILAVQIPIFYLYKMFVPMNYSVDYDVNMFGSGIADYRIVGSLILLTVIGTAAWRLRYRMPLFMLCLVWYLVALTPVLHIFETNPIVADRYAFLPTYPIFMLVATSQIFIVSRFQLLLRVLGIAVIISLAVTSKTRNQIWKSDKSLWEYTVQTAPYSAVAHINLARLLFINENECKRGLELSKRAQQLYPNDTNYDVFQGVLHLRANDPQNAIIDFNRALEKNSQHIETLINISTAYQMLGEREMGVELLKQAVNSTEPNAPGDLRETAREMLKELAGGNH